MGHLASCSAVPRKEFKHRSTEKAIESPYVYRECQPAVTAAGLADHSPFDTTSGYEIMTEQNGIFNGDQPRSDAATVPVVDCMTFTDNPEIIIDGNRYPFPNAVGGDYAFHITTINERLERNDFTDVKIYPGKLWASPAATVRHLLQCCVATRDFASFISCDGHSYESPVAALAAITDVHDQCITASIRDLATELASAWYGDEINVIEQELEALVRGTRVKIPKDLHKRVTNASNRLNSAQSEPLYIASLIDDRSIDGDLRVPAGWVFDINLNCTIHVESGDRLEGLLFVSSKTVERETREQTVELCWWSHGNLVRFNVPRQQLMRCPRAEELSGVGLPISSINAKLFVHYFQDYFRENDFGLQTEIHVARLGWLDETTEPTFVLGDRVIRPTDAPSTSTRIKLASTDSAVAQIGRAFRPSGSVADSFALIREVAQFPVIWFTVLASLASVLLRPLQLPGFIVDLCGGTSGGKTVTLILAASVWGDPFRKSLNPVWHAWECTQIFVERLATILRSLPVMLDETRLVKDPKLVGAVTYALANGKCKGRGNKTGLDVQLSWELNSISTGEQSLVSFVEQAGMRARIITLRGSPVPARDDTWRRRVEGWEQRANQHYGHIGPAFVRHVIDNYNELANWKSRIDGLKQELSPVFAQNSVAGRHLDYLALVTLTAELYCEWFGLPDHLRRPAMGVRQLLLVEYDEADRPKEALERLMDFVNANEPLFLNNRQDIPEIQGSNERHPQQSTYLGRWIDLNAGSSPGPFSLAIFQQQFEVLARQFGYTSDELLTAWKERGWLHLGERGQPLRNVRVNSSGQGGSKTIRSVCVKAEVLARLYAARRVECGEHVPSFQPDGNSSGTP